MRVLVAGMSARAVAESAHRAGCEVFSADCFGDLDLTAVSTWQKLEETDGIIAVALSVKPDCVVYASGVENSADEVEALLNEGIKVISPPPEILRRLRCPEELGAFCASRGFARPAAYAAPPRKGQFLVKRRNSGAGIGIRDWDENAPSMEPNEYLQEKKGGVPMSAIYAAGGGDAVMLGVSRQFAGESWLGASGYQWCGNLMPYDLPLRDAKSLLGELRRVGRELAREFGIAGAFGADFIFEDNTPWLLEVNPRICASFELAELQGGFNSFSVHLAAMSGRLPPEPEGLLEYSFLGKGIVYAKRDMTAPDTRGWSGHGRHDIPVPGTPLPAGTPICTVITPAFAAGSDVCRYLQGEAAIVWGECV